MCRELTSAGEIIPRVKAKVGTHSIENNLGYRGANFLGSLYRLKIRETLSSLESWNRDFERITSPSGVPPQLRYRDGSLARPPRGTQQVGSVFSRVNSIVLGQVDKKLGLVRTLY